MKKIKSTLMLLLFTGYVFSQGGKLEYGKRFSPVIKNEKLAEAVFVSDIMPEFLGYLSMPYNEKIQLRDLLKTVDSPSESYKYAQDKYHRQESYYKVLDFVSVKITTTCHGKICTASAANEVLSREQKNILNTADAGAEINLELVLKYKYTEYALSADNQLLKANYKVTLVPEVEAEYPGGFKEMTAYIKQNVFEKVAKARRDKVYEAIVNFSVTEEGLITGTKLTRSSTDLDTDKLILDAINKMPKWRPAKNTKGVKVKEEFTIPLGAGGC